MGGALQQQDFQGRRPGEEQPGASVMSDSTLSLGWWQQEALTLPVLKATTGVDIQFSTHIPATPTLHPGQPDLGFAGS
jgi:hypothetical protein